MSAKGGWLLLVPSLVLALGFSGCVHLGDWENGESAGETRIDRYAFDLGSVDVVKADITIGAGSLIIEGGATEKLMEGAFRYNRPSWKPIVRYEESGVRGELNVRQGRSRRSMGNVENTWQINLNEKVPIDLNINIGAGEAKLKLGKVLLRSVDINFGAGQLDLDLRGNPRRSFEVSIEGGVGQAIIHVPRDGVGVIADLQGGIGTINAIGLEKTGSHEYRNSAHGTAAVDIRLKVRGGIGEIQVIAD